MNEVLLNSFTGKVGTGDITNTSVDGVTVSGDDIIYDISFDYAPDPSDLNDTVPATGTVTFETDTGNYIVTLDDPITSYFTSSVFDNTTIAYLNSPDDTYGGGSQFEIANVDFGTGDFFVQFTGIDQTTSVGGTGNGEFFGTEGYVQLSSSDTGVNGNSIQDVEAIDFNFYGSDPGNNPDLDPSATATGFYIQIDQFNSNTEDFVVVLKLADPSDPNNYITRALRVDTNDVLTTDQEGYPAITGANQGLIIIEPNDYLDLPGVPDNYEIVGAQFLTSTEGLSPTLYDFNGALDAAGSNTTVGLSGTSDNDVVKITDIGVIRTTENSEALTLNLSVTVTDGDGDSFDQTLAVNPVTPVVLDLDGGGNVFSSLEAGVAYDYFGEGAKAKTAWVAAGSAILAFDANNDGMVTDASEFVFGRDGMTDLEALAVDYDTNGDGMLDMSDSTYGKFGVWLDSNLDGNSDPGEFVTLSDAGITSIDLASDGIAYSAGEGDVTVFGTSTFTWQDGSTGEVSDAGFATGGNVDAAMDALLALSADDGQSTQGESTEQVELDAVEEAMGDVVDSNAIDAIVDHFANHFQSGETIMKVAEPLSEGHDLLDIGLVNAMPITHGSLIADMADDASALVAAA